MCKTASCGLSNEPLYKGSLSDIVGNFYGLLTAVPTYIYAVMAVIGLFFVAWGVMNLRNPEKVGIGVVSIVGGGLLAIVPIIFATVAYGLGKMFG